MTDLLDMATVVQRQSSWLFELLDDNLQAKGILDVDRDRPPTLATDTSKATKRSLSNVRLMPGAINDVDVISDRLRVTMVTGDGTLWPQGVFIFSDEARVVLSAVGDNSSDVGALTLGDLSLIVDDPVNKAVSYGPGTLITGAITELLAELPITFTVSASGATITPSAEAVAWPAGTSRLRIVNELAAMVGYHELFFDNNGEGQLHPMPHPDSTPESQILRYPVGGRTYRASVVRATNLLKLPNRFLVINSGATDVPIIGEYNIPDVAPHSAMNRNGRVITHVEQMQGLASMADADVAAEALARQWRFAYETVDFSGPPDPRHDHYDTVEFEGTKFLELSWSMQLREGSEMIHNLRRIYQGEL